MIRTTPRPYLTVAVLLALLIGQLLIMDAYGRDPIVKWLVQAGLAEFYARKTLDIGVNVVLIFISLTIIWRLGLQRVAGVTRQPIRRRWLMLPLLVLVGLSALNVTEHNWMTIDYGRVGIVFLWAMSIGFFEEAFFRGTIQSILIKNFRTVFLGPVVAVFVAGLLFGLIHLVAFNKGSLVEELVQVGYATIIGVFFGAILLRTHCLLPIAFAHGFFNFFSALDTLKDEPALQPTPADSVPPTLFESLFVLVVLSPFLIFGLWQAALLKRKDVAHLLSNESEQQAH